MKQKVRKILVLIGWVVTNHTTVKFKNIWFDITNMSCEVQRRRWNWLGHVLRRGGENECVEEREVDQERLGEGLSRKKAIRQVEGAGVWPEWWHKKSGLGRQSDGLQCCR